MNEVLEVRLHGVTMVLRDTGGRIPYHWRMGNVYERPLLEAIRAACLSGTAVDVGANVGNHALWLAAVCGLHVIAFEPLSYRPLLDNVRLNGLEDRIRVEPTALGGTAGFARSAGRGRLSTGAGPVRVRRLDDYDIDDLCLVKVDVEGMEPQVLRGAEETVRRDLPIIVAEEWDIAAHQAVAEVIEPWGYSMVRRFSGPGARTPMGWWEARG